MLGATDSWVRKTCHEWPRIKIGSKIRFTDAQVAEIVELLTLKAAPPEPMFFVRNIGTRAGKIQKTRYRPPIPGGPTKLP